MILILIEKEIDVIDKNATLVWKRAKEDPIECGIFKFSFNDNVENILLIQNAPAFEGVKVLLNEAMISGKHYYNDKLI